MAKRKFYLLFRNENGQFVWQGAYFRNDELKKEGGEVMTINLFILLS